MTMQGYWICKFCEHRNVRDFEGLDRCESCYSQVGTSFTSDNRMTVKWQRIPVPGTAMIEVVSFKDELKRFNDSKTVKLGDDTEVDGEQLVKFLNCSARRTRADKMEEGGL
jgi:hypothetical protein